MARRGPFLVLGLVLPLLALAPQVKVDNSIEALLVEGDPEAATYRQFLSELGSDEPVVVSLFGGAPAEVLARAVALEEELLTRPEVRRSFGPRSLYPEVVTVLSDPVLGDEEAWRGAAAEFAGPVGRTLKVFEPERPAALIYAFLRPGTAEDRGPLLLRLANFRAEAEAAGHQVAIAGPPVLNQALDHAGKDVERVALPLLALAQVLMMLLTTRSLRATVCLFLTVGLAVAASDGVLVAMGATSNIVVATAKPLLLVLLLSSGVYVVEDYFHRLRSQAPALAAQATARHLRQATLLSLLTTIVGFGSLVISPIAPIRLFGGVSGVGLLLGAPLVLVFLPALLAQFVKKPPALGGPGLERWAVAAVGIARRHRILAITLGLALTSLGPWAVGQLRTEPHALHYFPKDHPIRRDAETLEANGVGLSTIELVLTSTASLVPSALLPLDALSQDLAQIPGVRGVIGVPLFLREVAFRAGGLEALPQPALVDMVLAERGEDLGFLMGDQGRRVRLSLLVETIDADQIDRLAEKAKEATTTRLGARAHLTVTGSYALLLSAQRGLLATLHGSLLSSALLMGLILLLALRSIALGLIALVPNVFPVSLLFLLMIALDLPLDLGTSMCAAIALGIAVDNTIHFIDTYRALGLEAAAQATGRPVIITTLVVSAGFIALIGSDFGPTRAFGILMALAMTSALAADLFQLPALLSFLDGPKAKASVSEPP